MEKFAHKLFPFSLFILPVVLVNATKLIVVSILLLLLASFLVKGRTKLFQLPLPLILLAGFYFIHVFGLMATENLSYAFKDLETKMSFLLFPLIYLIAGAKNVVRHGEWAKKGVVFGSLLAMLISMIRALGCSLSNGEFCWSIENYGFQMHGTYLTVIYLMGGVFLVLKQQKTRVEYFLTAAYLGLLGVSLILIESLSSLLCLLLLIAIGLIWAILKLKSKLLKIILLLVPIVLFYGITQHNKIKSEITYTADIVTSFVEDRALFIEEHSDASSSSMVRIVLYGFSLELLKAHPFGVGTGDVKDVLYQKYEENSFDHFVEKKYNPHSQFFQTGIALGIASMLYLLIVMTYPIVFSNRFQHREIIFLSIIILITCMFESYLERQVGVIFFSFALFFLSIPKIKSEEV